MNEHIERNHQTNCRSKTYHPCTYNPQIDVCIFQASSKNEKDKKKKTELNLRYLFAHGNRDPTIAAAAPHDAVHAPGAGDGDERRVEIAIDVEQNPIHLERDQGRGVAPAVHVRLVARHVRIVDDGGVGDDGVEHWGIGEVGAAGGPLHGRVGLGRGHRPVLAEVYPLGEAQPVLHRGLEIRRHSSQSFPATKTGVGVGRGFRRLSPKNATVELILFSPRRL